MTEEEISELDAFLLSDACGQDALSIDEAHGYLTALQLMPKMPEQSEWLDTVWGTPSFSGEEQHQRLGALLEAMRSEIAESLERHEPFEPMVVEMDIDGQLVEAYEGWCYGFMLAVEQQESQWMALPKQAQGLLAPIAQLALLESDEDENISEDEYSQWVELIPGAVVGLYDVWHRGG